MSLQEIFTQYLSDRPDAAQAIESWIDERLGEDGGIPKTRLDEVIGQRNALRGELQALRDELDALHNRLDQQPEVESLRVENEQLTQQVMHNRQQEWERFAPLFAVDESHPLYHRIQRIRDDFRFPVEDSTLSAEDLEHNLTAIRPYLKADYFQLPETPAVDGAKPFAAIPAPQADFVTLFQSFGG